MSPDITPSQPGSVCRRNRVSRQACGSEPVFEYKGRLYCILHLPDPGKDLELFQRAVDRKLTNGNFNFHSVWFPTQQRFTKAQFTTKADFVRAVFNGPVGFRKARFYKAAYFNRAKFRDGANFSQVNFTAGVNFTRATFVQRVTFYYAHFVSEVDFTTTTFNSEANFYSATFGDHVRFVGRKNSVNITSLDLQFARIEKPDRVYFHSLTARPSWFVNVDARRFDFINVEWARPKITDEFAGLTARNVLPPERMLAIAYRRLAVNAEENHRYEEASDFRWQAMEAARFQRARARGEKREGRKKRKGHLELRILNWLYRLVSGYGEQVWHALLVLIAIWFLFAALYTQVGFARWQPEFRSKADATNLERDEPGAPLTLARAFTYSGSVMILQQPDPRPATHAAHALVLLETILGPVQAALLALAIRRKFMR